jgi:hypothetical protein
MKEDLSVLILSCNKYSHLLPYFSYFFDKFWEPSNLYKKYITTESIILEHNDYNPILTQDANWTNSLEKALNQIKTPYVFIIVDDFFLVRTFPLKSIENALSSVKIYNLDKYVFHYPHEAFTGKLSETSAGDNVYKVKQDSEYTLTLQPSIWNVEFLKKCLKEGESPWQFEIDGSKRVNETIQHNIYMEIIPTGYHREAISRGEFTPAYYEMIQGL